MVSPEAVKTDNPSTDNTRALFVGVVLVLGFLGLACGGLVPLAEEDDDDSADDIGDDDTTPPDGFAGLERGFAWSGSLEIPGSGIESSLSGVSYLHYLADGGQSCTHAWSFVGTIRSGLGQVPGCTLCEGVLTQTAHEPVQDPIDCQVLPHHDLSDGGAALDQLYGVRGLVALSTAEAYDPVLPDGTRLSASIQALRQQGLDVTWVTVADLGPLFPALAGDPELGGLNFEGALVGGPTSPAQPTGSLIWYGLWLGAFADQRSSEPQPAALSEAAAAQDLVRAATLTGRPAQEQLP